MKKIFLDLSILLSTTILANELSWVDMQVDAIKPPRTGMKMATLKKIRDPFIFLEKNRLEEKKDDKKPQLKSKVTTNKNPQIVKKTIKKVLVLGLIMNNSAMISGKWYKLGDILNGYTISEINPNSVLLHKNKKELLLSTKSNTKKLKFLNK